MVIVQVAVRVSVVSTVAGAAASLCANIDLVAASVAFNNPAPCIVSDAPELVKVAAMATTAFDGPPVPVEFVQVAAPSKGVDKPAESAGSSRSISSSPYGPAPSSSPIYLKPASEVLLQTELPEASPPVRANNNLEAQFSPLFTTTLSPWE